MSIRFKIFPDRGLVYVHYAGFLEIESSIDAFSQYQASPDHNPGQKQLVDLSDVTAFERDYPRIFEMQMKKAEVFTSSGSQTIVVYLAPTFVGLQIANLAIRSWEDVPGVVTSVVQSEQQALEILGIGELSLEELKGSMDPAV